MKIVYASRTGNVQKLIDRFGAGIIPKIVEKFVDNNKEGLKAAAVSGNSERHPNAFCGAADKLAEKYGIEIIARFEKDGDESVENAIKAYIIA